MKWQGLFWIYILILMLAKSASKTWQENPDEEIYIERNGERFAYCLDYLRDNECHLPFGISKEAVMKDLEYFGVENIQKDSIFVFDPEGIDMPQVIILSHNVFTKIDEDIKDFHQHMKDLEFIKAIFKKLNEKGTVCNQFYKGPGSENWYHPFVSCLKEPITEDRKRLFEKYGLGIKSDPKDGFYDPKFCLLQLKYGNKKRKMES